MGAVSLPGGGLDERLAADASGEHFGINAHALLLGDVGLVDHEDDG
jgi:hypothetical protein